MLRRNELKKVLFIPCYLKVFMNLSTRYCLTDLREYHPDTYGIERELVSD